MSVYEFTSVEEVRYFS